MSVPRLVATWRFGLGACDAAWSLLEQGDGPGAVVAACDHAERDPTVDSVGYGGIPDGSGRVTLDASYMESPRIAAGVCVVGRHLAVAQVARLAAERTRQVLIAGPGADEFAQQAGVESADLLSPTAAMAPQGAGAHDTIGVLGVDAAGRLFGACSTSGLGRKRPGRVGDSPIIGHGLYVDPEVGAVTATGTGELIMRVCGSFLAVELMRRGASTLDALQEVLQRIDRTLDVSPSDQVAFLALRSDGECAGAALINGFEFAMRDSAGARLCGPGVTIHHRPANQS